MNSSSTSQNRVSTIDCISERLPLSDTSAYRHFIVCRNYLSKVLNNRGMKIVRVKEHIPVYADQLMNSILHSLGNIYLQNLIKKALNLSLAIDLNPEVSSSVRVQLKITEHHSLATTIENIIYIVFRKNDFTEEDQKKIKKLEELLLHKEVQDHLLLSVEKNPNCITFYLEPVYFSTIPTGDYMIIEMF